MADAKRQLPKWATALLAGGIVAALVSLLRLAGLLASIEYKTRDLRMQWTIPKSGGHPDIAMIYITDESLREVNKPERGGVEWPWPRDFQAMIFDGATRGGARLVLYDFFLSGRKDTDADLAPSLKKNGRAYIATAFTKYATDKPSDSKEREKLEAELARTAIEVDSDGSVRPLDHAGVDLPSLNLYGAYKGIADVNAHPDPDSIWRRYHLFQVFEGRCYPSYALIALMNREGVQSIRVRDRVVTVGSVAISVDLEGAILLRYYAPEATFRWFDADHVISAEYAQSQGQAANFDLGKLRDKIVIVGATARALYDLKGTPVKDTQAGPEIHAVAIANLLNRDYLRETGPRVSYALIVMLALVTALATRLAPAWAGGAATFLLLGGYLGADVLLFKARWVVDLAPQLVAIVLAFAATSAVNYLYEGKQKQRVKRTFQQYVSAKVVDKILLNPDAQKMQGDRKTLTIFFMDFAGFTTLSETLDPPELVKLITRYNNAAVEEIFKTEGTLDKFMGDCIMAFWGDPIEQPDHAVRACRTAIAIQPKLKELAEALKWHGLPGISARIGLNSGVAVAGNMGSDMQFNYTVIGSDVNLASRLEGVNKEFGTEIIISDATYQGAKEAVEVRPLARIQVKGQTKGVLIYELLGEKGAVDPERLESARAFEKALHLLWERKWDEARAIFSGYADPASKLYVELCAEYAKKPPAQNWDGTYVMTHK